jgi:hypothetical protein
MGDRIQTHQSSTTQTVKLTSAGRVYIAQARPLNTASSRVFCISLPSRYPHDGQRVSPTTVSRYPHDGQRAAISQS